MPIWEIVDHKIDVLEVSHLDAIVGIGPGEADRTHPSLMDKFGITRFSVCLQQQDKSPGWIIWQDYDPRTRPGFTEVEVKGQVHWGVELWNVQVGDTVVSCQQGCGAVLDSGTSLIAAPRQSLVHLKGALDTLHPDCSNMHDMPWLRFQIADKIMELPPQAYIARMVGVIPPTIWDVLSFKPQAKVVMLRALAHGPGRNEHSARAAVDHRHAVLPLLLHDIFVHDSSGTCCEIYAGVRAISKRRYQRHQRQRHDSPGLSAHRATYNRPSKLGATTECRRREVLTLLKICSRTSRRISMGVLAFAFSLFFSSRLEFFCNLSKFDGALQLLRKPPFH
jgi:hypothetical protein